MLSLLRSLLSPVPPKPEAKRSAHWPAVRARHLAGHPTCAACGGTVDLEVRHIAPFHLQPELELDEHNLLTLCEKPGHDCHFVWGHFWNWKRFNPTVVLDAAWWLAKSRNVVGH